MCEVVGLWILQNLRLKGIEANLYRDDGLLMSNKPARSVEIIKKGICNAFNEMGLKITIEANLNEVDFLDVTFNLENDTFEPYCKPGNIIQYVHIDSNHPSIVIKNIPIGIEERLNGIAKNEELFNKDVKVYQDALDRAGHRYKLSFKPKVTKINLKIKENAR